MATPANHLPQPIPEDAINALLVAADLPRATEIISPRVTAQYHSIYKITLPPNNKLGHTDLVLRVPGHHLPRIKLESEVGVMSWVSKNTTIPIPKAVAYDASVNNPISHEYTLLSWVKGATLSEIHQSLNNQQITQTID